MCIINECVFLIAGNWGGNSSGQTSSSTNNTQQWNNSQRPPTSQADCKYLKKNVELRKQYGRLFYNYLDD